MNEWWWKNDDKIKLNLNGIKLLINFFILFLKISHLIFKLIFEMYELVAGALVHL